MKAKSTAPVDLDAVVISPAEKKEARAHIKGLLAKATGSIGDRVANRVRNVASKQSIPEMIRFFESMSKRAKAMNPGHVGDNLAVWCSNAIEDINTENWLRDRAQLMVAAAQGDPDARIELAEIQRFATGNLLLAHANWAAFYDMQTLANGDQAYLEFSTGQELKFETMGEDGGLRRVQAALDKTQYPVGLFYLWSEEFEYPLVDLYKGDVASLALATIDATRDQAQKLNILCGANIFVGGASSRIGNFTLDGSATATYVPHSGIATSNLPTTNLLAPPSGNTTTSLLRKEVFDQAIKYVTRWGSGAFADGTDLQVVALHVASAHASDWIQQVSLSSVQNFAVDQIFQGGAIVDYAGFKFPIVADNTIPATGASYAYLRTNKPVGTMFEKPGLDQVVTEEEKRHNKGVFAQGKVLGFGLPGPSAVNVAAIQYKTAS